jgi:hypothetical protein
MLRFCEKEPSKLDKIENILQTMLPSNKILQHQYHGRNYQNYSDLIHVLLQAENMMSYFKKSSPTFCQISSSTRGSPYCER